jgi:hypothetical protein
MMSPGLSAKAFRARNVERLIKVIAGSPADIQKAAAVAADGVDANSDLHADGILRGGHQPPPTGRPDCQSGRSLTSCPTEQHSRNQTNDHRAVRWAVGLCELSNENYSLRPAELTIAFRGAGILTKQAECSRLDRQYSNTVGYNVFQSGQLTRTVDLRGSVPAQTYRCEVEK